MIQICNEKDLLDNLETGKKGDRFSYEFICRICGIKSQKRNTKSFLIKQYHECGFNRLITCRKCSVRLGRSSLSREAELKALEKRRQTNLKKYGVENIFQNLELIKKSYQEKLGVDNPSQLQVVKEKKKVTTREHFGVDNPSESETLKRKAKETSLKKYGTEYPMQSQEIKDRMVETNRQRFGVDYYTQTVEAKEYLKQLWADKRKKAQLSEKVSLSWSHKTTEEIRAIQSKRHKCFKYQDEYFDSSWELAVWIWAKDHNMQIEREPVCIEYEFEGKVHRYFPDFKINDQLVEVKGDFFFENDKLISPFDRSKDPLYEVKYKKSLEAGVVYWRKLQMEPILNYIEEKYTGDFLNLFEINLEFPYEKTKGKSDLDLIRYFHKSIYEASKKGKLSPLQAWQDKELIKKSALNRLQYVHNCKPKSVLQGFSVALIAPKVSVFKPKTAEYLIKKYLNDFDEIFDPFSGFSGRMIGTMNCNKKYTGQDINEKHVTESNEIIQYKNYQNCTVVQQDILTDIEQTHECLFTCPPYGGKEHWNENNDEVEKTCDEWIDTCLKKYKCKRYLFVVDETEKYKDCIVEMLDKNSLFGKKPELVILLNR